MEVPDIFFNDAGRLRSVWRLALFAVAYFVVLTALFLAASFGLAFLLSPEEHERLLAGSNWAFVIQSFIYFLPAALAGWRCSYVPEDLPSRALGWALHRGCSSARPRSSSPRRSGRRSAAYASASRRAPAPWPPRARSSRRASSSCSG